jgi:NitT/TauT family transport system permease protein
MRRSISSLVLLVCLLLFWEITVRMFDVSALVVPTPSNILLVLWDGLIIGFLWHHIWITSVETLLGFVLGSSIGFICGVILGEIDKLRRLLWPYVLATQVVPKLALGPIFIVWFGFGITSTVVITALICFFPLVENTMTGLQIAAPEKRELFRMLGAGRWKTLVRLKIPAGLPTIMAGVRLSIVLALVGAVVGEFIGGSEGLGASIIAAQGMMDSPLMFALFILITLMGILFYQFTLLFERWLLRNWSKGEIL